MTRIITITSGSTRAGKTQLAINLALERVRRGRQVGVFQDTAAARALDGLLELHQSAVPHRRASDLPAGDVVRRGYQGVDFLTCRLRLEEWADGDADRLKTCIHDLDTHDGYDDLLIDTSGMEPGAILACCLASAAVIVVVTPDAPSQAEAFALLRILRLNGFDGTPGMLVNRLQDAQQSGAIHHTLNEQLQEHLGLELPLLGGLAEDDHVSAAQRARQAVSSVYPDSDAAGVMVSLADALETLGTVATPARQTVTRFWKTFLEKVRAPLQLPGQHLLGDVPERAANGSPNVPAVIVPAETGLVQFDGSLATLCDTLIALPETLGVLAHDMTDLVTALASEPAARTPATGNACDERACLQLAAAILSGVCERATQRERIHLQITECRINGEAENRLPAGNYMRFTFRVSTQGGLMERLKTVFACLLLPLNEPVQDNAMLWEQVNPAHSTALGVSVSLPDELRLVLWVPAKQGRDDVVDAAASLQVPTAAR